MQKKYERAQLAPKLAMDLRYARARVVYVYVWLSYRHSLLNHWLRLKCVCICVCPCVCTVHCNTHTYSHLALQHILRTQSVAALVARWLYFRSLRLYTNGTAPSSCSLRKQPAAAAWPHMHTNHDICIFLCQVLCLRSCGCGCAHVHKWVELQPIGSSGMTPCIQTTHVTFLMETCLSVFALIMHVACLHKLDSTVDGVAFAHAVFMHSFYAQF